MKYYTLRVVVVTKDNDPHIKDVVGVKRYVTERLDSYTRKEYPVLVESVIEEY